MGRFKEASIRAQEALQATKGTRTPLRQREGPTGPFSRPQWPFFDQRETSLPLQDQGDVAGAQRSGSVDA